MKVFLVILGILCMTALTYAQCGEIYYGEGTFYGYGGGGNCSFPDPQLPAMTGAMNQLQYDTSNICGACVEVTGARGSLNIRIEDRCPECAFGDIDLAESAFPLVANPVDGRVPISWKIVPCPVTGPIQFYFKEGSSQWWTAVQIRNHKYPVARFEYKRDGTWREVERMMYNYFLVSDGMGVEPYEFRITDIFGNEIVETNVPFIDTTVIDGTQQFPTCVENELLQQTIALSQGWNLISLNIEPDNPAIGDVFPYATIVKNMEGFYNSALPPHLNSFIQIQGGTGYLVYNVKDETRTIVGSSITTISQFLIQGWNLIGIPSQEIEAVSSLPAEVETIKDFEDYFERNNSYNTLNYLTAGKAYFVKASGMCEITW